MITDFKFLPLNLTPILQVLKEPYSSHSSDKTNRTMDKA